SLSKYISLDLNLINTLPEVGGSRTFLPPTREGSASRRFTNSSCD
ncbi:hypothetical protein GBAR_LOCUS25119, partial [Geodia barretti]